MYFWVFHNENFKQFQLRTCFNYFYFFIFQNAHFYLSRSLLNKAKELAAKKDIKALEELSTVEVCSDYQLMLHPKYLM